MEKVKKISLFDNLGENVFTRTTMRDFLSKVSKTKDKKIAIDFRKVKFVSRSCADEYIKFLSNSKKEIESVNASPEVSMMMKVVKSGLIISVSKEENPSCAVCKN